jgi:hypothetical protein
MCFTFSAPSARLVSNVTLSQQSGTRLGASVSWFLSLLLFFGAIPHSHGESYTWNTLAGAPGGWGNVDGAAGAARFASLNGVALDAFGNVYVADADNHTIRKVTSAGLVSTLAGSAGNAGSDDGTGGAARFSSPSAVASDATGNLYVADSVNGTIRKITSAGVVSTLAGTSGSLGSADGTGAEAQFLNLGQLALDAAGNIFVADGSCVRKVTSVGVVSTIAGAPNVGNPRGSTDGVGTVARFYEARGVAVDIFGNVFVADTYNHTIRKIDASGVVTTLAGAAGVEGSDDGTGSAARFKYPYSVAVDGSGNLYVADSGNHAIRRITSAGVVSTLAGMPGVEGSVSGAGRAAQFRYPVGVALDASGNLYVGDHGNRTLRKITKAGDVSNLAGAPRLTGGTDGTRGAARFNSPGAVASDATGNL